MTTGNEDRMIAEELNNNVRYCIDGKEILIDDKQDFGWLLAFIGESFCPEDVFPDSAICTWAENNGYVPS